MYKVGDKLICKKSYTYSKNIYFILGKQYEITDVNIRDEICGSFVRLSTSEPNNYRLWTWSGKDNNQSFLKCEDYFCTQKELRKQKLEILRNVL